MGSRLKAAWGLVTILGWSWSGHAAALTLSDGLAGQVIRQSIITAQSGKESILNLDPTARLPDGGSTVALLGIVLLGIECLRRKVGR